MDGDGRINDKAYAGIFAEPPWIVLVYWQSWFTGRLIIEQGAGDTFLRKYIYLWAYIYGLRGSCIYPWVRKEGRGGM